MVEIMNFDIFCGIKFKQMENRARKGSGCDFRKSLRVEKFHWKFFKPFYHGLNFKTFLFSQKG
jgi:hypothetical protein